jgi:hypothetical protein
MDHKNENLRTPSVREFRGRRTEDNRASKRDIQVSLGLLESFLQLLLLGSFLRGDFASNPLFPDLLEATIRLLSIASDEETLSSFLDEVESDTTMSVQGKKIGRHLVPMYRLV